MRVDFMTPVQRVMASASHFATAMYAKNEAEKYREEQNQKAEERAKRSQEKAKQEQEYREKRMALEEKKIGMQERRTTAFERQTEGQFLNAETKRYQAETDRLKAGFTKSGRMRPRSAVDGYMQTQTDGMAGRNAVPNMRRFASGEIDLSQFKKEE